MRTEKIELLYNHLNKVIDVVKSQEHVLHESQLNNLNVQLYDIKKQLMNPSIDVRSFNLLDTVSELLNGYNQTVIVNGRKIALYRDQWGNIAGVKHSSFNNDHLDAAKLFPSGKFILNNLWLVGFIFDLVFPSLTTSFDYFRIEIITDDPTKNQISENYPNFIEAIHNLPDPLLLDSNQYNDMYRVREHEKYNELHVICNNSDNADLSILHFKIPLNSKITL